MRLMEAMFRFWSLYLLAILASLVFLYHHRAGIRMLYFAIFYIYSIQYFQSIVFLRAERGTQAFSVEQADILRSLRCYEFCGGYNIH